LNRIDRLMGILTILQSKKFTPADYLAKNFEISIRTVYRDIRALDEIGVPISFENNKGYFVVQGYFLPPVSFTPDEANALILLDAIAHRFTDKSILKHYETALNKVKTVMKPLQKEQLESLRLQIVTFKPDSLHNEFEYLSVFQMAISSKTVLEIEYEKTNQEKSKREVEPIGLLFYGMNWHLIAWCWKRNDYRDFRASRILKLTNTNLPFRKNNHLSLNDYLKEFPENI
jgi:predicted DNA-binding transcriptional regulator YafY